MERTSSAFGELTSTVVSGAHTLLLGVAAELQRYRNAKASRFDESRATPAIFLQQSWAPADWLATQVNGRCDASSTYGTICTPRLSLLAHSGSTLSARLSGGAGWAARSPLIEETEVFGLSPLVGPLHPGAERRRPCRST